MKKLGTHLVAELTGCSVDVLNNVDALKGIFTAAAEKSGATVVNVTAHRYSPQGVSVVVVISESHVSVHTWPEYGYAAVDFFTCGERVDPYIGLAHISQALNATDTQVQDIPRGIPSVVEGSLPHK